MLREAKRKSRVIIPCGSRENTFRDFQTALKSDSDVLNILLVDAEGPVYTTPWQHLKKEDNWDKPSICDDSCCHLMVQVMEAWFITDVEALRKYYGQGFKDNAIPKTTNIEEIGKAVVCIKRWLPCYEDRNKL